MNTGLKLITCSINHYFPPYSSSEGFCILLEGTIYNIKGGIIATTPELLREIANRIEQNTEYSIKPWIFKEEQC